MFSIKDATRTNMQIVALVSINSKLSSLEPTVEELVPFSMLIKDPIAAIVLIVQI